MTCPCGGQMVRAPTGSGICTRCDQSTCRGDLYACVVCNLQRCQPQPAPIPPRAMRRMLSAAMGGKGRIGFDPNALRQVKR